MTDNASLVQLVVRDGTHDERILAAFRSIDRADFVPPEYAREAYQDHPVPIPEHQTTSQPSLIARMIEAARVDEAGSVLEIGAGYGYQTALLARLAQRVVSIERFPALADAARSNLERAGIEGVLVIVGDGWEGYEEEAPYSSIVVSAAASEVPEPLQRQLAEGGRLVIPVTTRRSDDVLVFEKKEGRVERLGLLTPARFVPLIRGRLA